MENIKNNKNPFAKKKPTEVVKEAEEEVKSKLTFTKVFIVLTVAVLFLMSLALIFRGVGEISKREVAEGIQEFRLDTDSGEIIFNYKIYDKGDRKVLFVVTNRTDDRLRLSSIINNIIYSEGLTVAETDVVLHQDIELNGLSIEEYFAEQEKNVDPTNPLFDSGDTNIFEGAEDIEPIDFKLYIGSTGFFDYRFNITPLGNNSFRVELKNGYTEDQFNNEFLSQFLNTDNLIFNIVDQNDLRTQNP